MTHVPEELLHGFIDRQIDKSQSRTVEAHLKSCLSCKKRHDDLVRLNRLIIHTGDRKPSDKFTAAVMNRIANLPASSSVLSKGGAFLRIHHFFAAALTLLAVVLTISYYYGNEADTQSSTTMMPETVGGELVESYLSESIEYTASFIKRLTGISMGGFGDSSPLLMVLFFVGSILIYQVIELLQDWLRQRRSTISLLL